MSIIRCLPYDDAAGAIARGRSGKFKQVGTSGFRQTGNIETQIQAEFITMPKTSGRFVWYDVMTTDTKAAEAFYQSVIGWGAKDSGRTDRSYSLFSVGTTTVGGLMPIPEDARKMGVGPAWMGYIGVDDVDADAGPVKKAGGTIHRGPENIPGVGRFAVAGDPHGGGFMLFQTAGTSSTRATSTAPSTSIPACLAGPRIR